MSVSTLPRVSPNSKPVQQEEREVSFSRCGKLELSEVHERPAVVIYGIGKYTFSFANNASSPYV